MKIGDIVKSRHTEQEYKVVEVNKKHKCAYLLFLSNKKATHRVVFLYII